MTEGNLRLECQNKTQSSLTSCRIEKHDKDIYEKSETAVFCDQYVKELSPGTSEKLCMLV